MPFLAGLDRGAAGQAVCCVDGTGRIEVRHDAVGLAGLSKRLGRIAAPADLPVAIERPSGLIVDALVAAGHPVVPIRPNVAKACRPRCCAAGAAHPPAAGPTAPRRGREASGT